MRNAPRRFLEDRTSARNGVSRNVLARREGLQPVSAYVALGLMQGHPTGKKRGKTMRSIERLLAEDNRQKGEIL